jgi:hypothetical protein
MVRKQLVGRVRAVAVGLLAGGAVLAGGTSAAFAGQYTMPDRTDDVVAIAGDDAAISASPGPAGDIVSMRTIHGPYNVRIRLRLRSVPASYPVVVARVATSSSRRNYYAVAVGAHSPERFLLHGLDGDHEVACKGLRAGFRPREHDAFVIIPRRCIGNPRWVRTGGAFESMPLTSNDDSLHLDIAGSGPATKIDLARPVFPLGPRIRAARR